MWTFSIHFTSAGEFLINFNLLCALFFILHLAQHLSNRAAKGIWAIWHSFNELLKLSFMQLSSTFFSSLRVSIVSFIWWLMMIVYESASLYLWCGKEWKVFHFFLDFFYSWKTMRKEIKVLHCNFHLSLVRLNQFL